MTDNYNRADIAVTTASQTVTTVLPVTEAWLLYINVYNITAGTDCTFKVWLEDSLSVKIMQLTADYSPLPGGSAELIIDRPIGMVTGDKIVIQGSANLVCRCSAFVLETV